MSDQTNAVRIETINHCGKHSFLQNSQDLIHVTTISADVNRLRAHKVILVCASLFFKTKLV